MFRKTKEKGTHEVMSQNKATRDDEDRCTTRRPPWPAPFVGDSEQSVPARPAQWLRNSDAVRVGTDVLWNQCHHCARIADLPRVVEPHEPLDGRDDGGHDN